MKINMLREFIRGMFVIAAVKDENKAPNGEYDWNFIEADIYLGLKDLGIDPCKYADIIAEEFEKCAIVLEEMGEAI